MDNSKVEKPSILPRMPERCPECVADHQSMRPSSKCPAGSQNTYPHRGLALLNGFTGFWGAVGRGAESRGWCDIGRVGFWGKFVGSMRCRRGAFVYQPRPEPITFKTFNRASRNRPMRDTLAWALKLVE